MKSVKLGVLEGFYGRPWSDAGRRDVIRWLSALGFHAYLYAPKADPWLRRRWREPWPRAERQALEGLARCAEDAGLLLGIGLSPFGIYRNYSEAERRALRDRVSALNDLRIGCLAILFDDMPGAQDDLAEIQGEVMADVLSWTEAGELLMCPTYYSDDPVLDRVFGDRPERYLEDLSAALPQQVAVFWTGRRVCSDRISAQDLPTDAVLSGRPLALWDNYPVNDSKSRSEHLYLQPFSGRDKSLAERLHWHFSNAMNQPALSMPALASLAALYGSAGAQANSVLQEAGIDAALIEACEPLASRSAQQLSTVELARLRDCADGSSRAAEELREFLAGAYRFDPACLTD